MKRHFSKKETQQLAVIALFVGVALTYGLWRFAAVPMRKAAHERAAKYTKIVAKNQAAQEAVSAIPDHEATLAAINEDLVRITRDYAVRPVLGSSYHLGLRQRLDPLARQALFNIQSLTVKNPGPLPWRRPGTPLSLCTADIRGTGSFEQIRDFIAFIETENPYMHIAGLTVKAQPSAPKRHHVTIRLECISAPTELKLL